MGRHLKRIAFLAAVAVVLRCGGLVADSLRLRRDFLRLHVVADSDGAQDQALKLQVRDAVLQSLEEGLQELTDPQAAVGYVSDMLPKLEAAANRVLADAGSDDTASVSLQTEKFPRRDYDTFSLPAGVYRALRVTIGEGEGRNWWCVVFPQLCTGAAAEEEFVETARMNDLPESLTRTLSGEYEIRFWLLDKLGEVQKFFFDPSA